MKNKRTLTVLALIAVMALSAFVVSARGGRQGDGDMPTPQGRGIMQRLYMDSPLLNIRERIAETTGLTLDEIRTAVHGGQSFADLLTEKGVDLDTFKAEVLTGVRATLDEAITNDRLTQTVADELFTRAEEHIDTMLSGEMPIMSRLGRMGQMREQMRERMDRGNMGKW